MACDTPVLLVVWRRPDLTELLIESLRPVAPTQLYIACDGFNQAKPEQFANIQKTREMIRAAIDWPCERHGLFADKNYGCRDGEIRAFNWFFEHVSEGIILEDDTIPHPDFFPYCQELLDRYRDDPRVWCISGDNAARITLRGPWSYGFIRTPLTWGWATWKRTWHQYDVTMSTWRRIRNSEIVSLVFPDPYERELMRRIYNGLVDYGVPDTWDYQFGCDCILSGGLCVIPRNNLIRNVGFGVDATNTFGASPRSNAETYPILPLDHPPIPFLDQEADQQVFTKIHGGRRPDQPGMLRKLYRRLKSYPSNSS